MKILIVTVYARKTLNKIANCLSSEVSQLQHINSLSLFLNMVRSRWIQLKRGRNENIFFFFGYPQKKTKEKIASQKTKNIIWETKVNMTVSSWIYIVTESSWLGISACHHFHKYLYPSSCSAWLFFSSTFFKEDKRTQKRYTHEKMLYYSII